MHCSICNSFKRPIDGNERIHWRKDLPWSDLRKSSEECHCCGILLGGALGCLQRHGHEVADLVALDIHLAYSSLTYPANEYDCEKLMSIRLKSGGTVPIEMFVQGDEQYPEAWDDFLGSQRTTAGTGSEEAIEKAKKWIAECMEQHDSCKQIRHSPLPTRVIDVGLEDDLIRLYETRGEKAQYVALSHCWGPRNIIKTTLANKEERKRSICAKELSRTFQEAISITRRLGVKYIWIDALSIVQDDKADWIQEASNMASIFAGACLTISATKSSSGDGGLFTPTPDFEVTGHEPIGGDAYQLYFRLRINHVLSYETQDTTAPLFSRAWCFQERILSPRVLHFGSQELFFECNTGSNCECGDIYGYEVPTAQPKLSYADIFGSPLNLHYLAKAWRSIIMQYCDLRLTVKSDILPALGGVARQLAKRRNSRYLAGLWEDTLVEDLLWQGDGWNKRRPAVWRAPTWSWASIEDGSVYYEDAPLFWRPEEAWQQERVEGDFIPSCEVRSCSIISAGVDEFGELDSGTLELVGGCFQTSLVTHPREDAHVRLNRINPSTAKLAYRDARNSCFIVWKDGSLLEISPDYDLVASGPHHVATGTHLLCIHVATIKKMTSHLDVSTKLSYHYLILIPASGKRGCFERIGWTEAGNFDSLEETSLCRQTVTII